MVLACRPFVPADAAALRLPPATEATVAAAAGDWRAAVCRAAACGPAWTGLLADGRVIACGGLWTIWPGRAAAWCYLGADIPKPVWPALHRAVLAVLRSAGLRRIEADVRAGWAPGERWVRLLGFACEAPSRPGFAPDGTDCGLWARVAA